MSHECCSFCEQLPARAEHGWGGRASKCPVCKQELWTANGGDTYRLDDTLPKPPARRWPWVAGAVMVVSVGLIGVLLATTGRERTRPTPLAVKPTRAPVIPIEEPASEPLACVKPASGEVNARVKPSASSPVEPTRVEPVKVVAKADTPPAPAKVPVVPATDWSILDRTEHLAIQLQVVPQVDLDPEYMKKSKQQIAQLAKDIVKENDGTKDAFVAKLVKDRADLAGMPFLMGKDCSISDKDAKALSRGSLAIRSLIAEAMDPRRSKSGYMPSHMESVGSRFWNNLSERDFKNELQKADAIPALQQILLAEDREFRARLVGHMKKINDPRATELLAGRAIFDLDPDVRQAAILLLRDRPKAEYRATLMKGLRYPWQPVVRNAAHAIATLEMKDAVPDLISILDEPDPGTPYMIVENGKQKYFVRELVRVNHHRNCMLCHAPLNNDSKEEARAADLSQFPIGPVVSASEPLPPSSSPVYYARRSGSLLVRADVTYLRQDFSLQQPVEEPGKWSSMQRFDFLVRTRELNEKSAEAQQAPLSVENQEAVVSALRRLTGRNAPPQAQAWRDLLDIPAMTATGRR